MGKVTPENIVKLGVGFWASKTLLSAVELGVFKTLASGPAEPAVLQAPLGLHPRSRATFSMRLWPWECWSERTARIATAQKPIFSWTLGSCLT